MGRLIDADELSMWLKRLGRFLKVEDDNKRVCLLVGKIINHIEASKTVDAAKVVRCKDCKYRKSTFSGQDYYCTVWDADESETAYVTDDDFCSYGEPKGGTE